MIKLKVGDRVKHDHKGDDSFEGMGTIRFISSSGIYANVQRDDGKTGGGDRYNGSPTWNVPLSALVYVGHRKEVPPKFIAVYDLRARDPYMTFSDEKELSDWIEVQKDNPDFVMKSLTVYTVSAIRKMKFSWKLA